MTVDGEYLINLGDRDVADLHLIWSKGADKNLTKFRFVRGGGGLRIVVEGEPVAQVEKGRKIVKVAGTGADRHNAKRQRGISKTRYDGSETDPEVDKQAYAAEQAAADLLGCRFDHAVYADGDGGHDFVFPLTIEVVWLGFVKGTDIPREDGHLIMSPAEPWRWADIYVVMAGNDFNGFKCLGWTTHAKLSKRIQDFGYGPRFAMPTNELEPIERLMGLKVKKGNGL